MVSLTLEDGTTVDYTHDASGNRTSRSIDGVLDASWAWDDLSALPMRIGEYDSTGTLATSWLADPTSSTGASLAQTTNGASSWLLSDPFANTIATVSTTGDTVSGTRTMNAFGVERLPATGALADAAVGFAGQYLDAATGLYDMRARDYDPTSGRFTATDPVAVPTGMPYVAGYSYAFNNPLMFTDVSGLTATSPYGYAGGGSYGSGGSSSYTPPSSETADYTSCGQDPARFPYTHAGHDYGPEWFQSDVEYGVYIWQDLQAQPSSWSHWNDPHNLGLEQDALAYGYSHGGHTYVGGPICGLYAVCVTGVSQLGQGENNITFGRVILFETKKPQAWLQFHEYTHLIDYVDVGAERFLNDYVKGAVAGIFHGGLHGGNWLEKTAIDHSKDALSAWIDDGGEESGTTGPRLLPETVKDVYWTTSYTDLSCG